jgi:ribosomal protein L11 methyltransferase
MSQSLCEIRAELPPASVETVDEQLLELGDARWSVLHDVIEGRAWVIGIFADAGAAEAAWQIVRPLLGEVAAPVVRTLAPTDWRDSYKAHFKPWRCGRLHWVPVWERASYPVAGDEVVIWLDPGLAFGTGNHETTRLCCERLVAWAEGRTRSAAVIDAGCGSGILALSAARLGFRDVRGFDNDPEAVRVSGENAALNDLAATVRFATADLVAGLSGAQADLLLANIQADILVQFSSVLLRAVAPGGTLALSGILARERDAVRETFAAAAPDWGLESRILGEWADVALTCPMAH